MADARVIEFPFTPLPVHLPFHASTARVKVAIGGVGSGKTRALCMEATRFALAQPGSDMLLTRRTVPDLRRTTEKELFEALPDELVRRCKIVRLGGHVESITFPNHSQLTLVGMEDWQKHKAVADDQPVLTAGGWRPMGSLQVGDEVIGADGRPTPVRAVFPQGERQMYRVSTGDGGSVEVDAEHWWTVYRQGARREEHTVRTRDLKMGANRDVLPRLKPVAYSRHPGATHTPVEPYVLGALLGDGGLTQRQISFTCSDDDAPEIVGALRRYLGDDAVRKLQAPMAYSLPKTRSPELYAELEREGLLGRGSRDKFIPERYLRAAPSERVLLLKGLMDTDGCGGPANRFVSVSRRLAEGVVELARSLDCAASLRVETNRFGPVYVAALVPPAGTDIFRLRRKASATFRHTRCGAGRTIKSVEPTRLAPCTCIEVEAADGLFVVKDYIVTHNSMNLAWIGIDEASEQTRENIEGIENRLRQTKPLKGAPPLARGQKMVNQMALASNPAGQDHLWEMYVNPASRRGDCSLHLSTPMDNPYLPAEYFEFLLQMPVPYIRRFVECRFDAAAGRVYQEWAWDTHVLKPRAPGAFGQLVWMAMDPGVMSPTAALWAEVDQANHRLVVVQEYQEPGRAAKEHADAWRRTEAKLSPARVGRRVADPSITKRDQGTTMELADIYGRLGFHFEKGPVRHDVRIPALANAIANYEFVCTENCPNLYEQIQNARWEDQAPRLRDLGEFREKIKKGNDHEHDCAQYLASIHVPGVHQRERKVVVEENTPLVAAEPALDMQKVEAAWHAERVAKAMRRLRSPQQPGRRDGVIV